jgi:hypothetical protein
MKEGRSAQAEQSFDLLSKCGHASGENCSRVFAAAAELE